MADDRNVDLSQKAHLTVGSNIKCRYQGGEVEGQVQAFHMPSRLLIIKAPASNGKSNNNDIIIINADCIEMLSIVDGAPVDTLKAIDFSKLDKRRTKSIGLKKAKIRALSADVAPEGRKLFLTITKTIDDVNWDGDKIIVLNEVTISPPYQKENVSGDKEASVNHIKKVVDKHWTDISQPPP